MDDETLKIFAYVNISSYRVRSVKALKGEIKTPTDIAKDADIKLNHISKVLSVRGGQVQEPEKKGFFKRIFSRS